MEDIGNWIFKTASNYPDVLALILGSLIGWVLVLMVETYFLPIETDPAKIRKQRGLTFLMTWFFSGAASSILWSFLDPSDQPTERIIVSYLVGILAFAGYPLIGRVITHFIPAVGSAWASKDK